MYNSCLSCLFLALLFRHQIAVLETEEVEHSVETDGVDGLLGVGLHSGLGMEGYAETGFGYHGQVVGSVAHGDGLRKVYFLHLGYQFEQFCLAVTVNDFPGANALRPVTEMRSSSCTLS